MPATVSDARPEQRIVEASMVLPDFGGVTGWAALRWLGGAWFDGLAGDGRTRLPVDLAVGMHSVRNQPGLRISEERLGPPELHVHDGLRVTTALRSVAFAMRHAPSVPSAVVALDMAAYSDLVSIEEVTAYVATHPGWTGAPQARAALELADENAWSPQETRMRLVWLAAGLPRIRCNVPVFDRAGRLVGVPDILDEEAGLAGEYDGSLHLVGEQWASDITREEELRRVGLEYFTVVSSDFMRIGALMDRMHSTRSRALFQAESARAWTLEQPTWWTPTETVEQRRSLGPAERERWLRLRRRAS